MIIQDRFKKFITDQMKNLAEYDSLRPEGHVYEFHLHSERVAQSMKALALKMGYKENMAETLYWATLPHDIGKMALPVEIWDTKERPTEEEKTFRRTHTTLGAEMVRDAFDTEYDGDPFLKLIIDIMQNHHETLNGMGFLGKKGGNLSKEVRMACICDAYDGWSIRRPDFDPSRDLSPKAVIKRMETEKAGQFDTEILKSFKEVILCSSKSYSLSR